MIIHYPRHATCRNGTNTCQRTVIFPNIPTVCVAILKAREREIGPAIENIANKSCDLQMEEEKMECGSIQDQAVPIGASYDMGWQKRGKGHNSLTGTENNLRRLLTAS